MVTDVLLFGWVLDVGFSLRLAPNTEIQPLLTWRKAQETVPWNIILLLGGGFAMAKGCEVRQQSCILSWCYLGLSFGSGKFCSCSVTMPKRCFSAEGMFLSSPLQQRAADK